MEDIIESIKSFFLIKSGRVTVPCDIAFRLFAYMLIFGLIGQVALVGHRAVLVLSSKSPSEMTLAELMPQVPTWFLPETLPGYALVIALMCVALWGRMLGRRIDAWHGHA